jgi:hypothetical protein
MGQEILYCFKCQERVTGAQLEAGKGLRFGLRTACRKCVPELLATLSEKERKEFTAKGHAPASQDPRTSTGKYVLSTATPRSRSIPAVTSKPAPRSNAVWLVGVGIVGILIAIAVVVMNSGETTPVRENPVPLPPSKAIESSRERSAREALERAKSLPASDLDAQVAAYTDAERLAEGTPYQREAKERHDGILEMRVKAYARELAGVEERARVPMNKEEFGAALALFDAARTLHAGREWKAQVDARVEQQRKAVEAAYADLKSRALLAKGKGAEGEVKALRERLSHWGQPELAKDLDAQLAAVPPPVEARPWTPLFDGKSLDFLVGQGEGAWRVEDGAIVHVKERTPSAQTKKHFADGEFRIVFECRGLHNLGFAIRQDVGYPAVAWNRAELDVMAGKTQELIFVFRGHELFATLNGSPQKIVITGKPGLSGPLQFNGSGDYFSIKSIEFREPGLNDGLVGYWTFDSISGQKAPDSSPLKNDGLLVDGPVVVPGRVGNALQFDGRRAHVLVPSHPSLVLAGPFTLCAWVKPAGPERRSGGIVEKWDNSPGSIDGYFLRLIGGRPHLVVYEPAEGGEVSSTKLVPPEEWTFLSGVFDGTQQLMYVNGVLDRKVAGTRVSKPSTNTLRIGLSGGDGGQYFAGAIDEVRVYNRALSASEIARLAKAP